MNEQILYFLEQKRQEIISKVLWAILVFLFISLIVTHYENPFVLNWAGIFIFCSGILNDVICIATQKKDTLLTWILWGFGIIVCVFSWFWIIFF